MDINEAVKNLQKEVFEDIKASGLPPVIARLILQNLCNDLLNIERQMSEQAEQDAQAKEKDK